MEKVLDINNSSIDIFNSLSKSYASIEDIEENYNYYWGIL